MTGTPILGAAVTAALVVSALAAPRAMADPPVPGGCHDGVWGARVQGSPPSFDGGDRAGEYLWHDESGFHLRVTHRGDGPDVFTGTISSPTPMRLVPVRLEGEDRADLAPDGRTLWFSFTDYGHLDGIDFITDCADHLAVGPLTVDGWGLPPGRVYLGAAEIHPDQVPFVVARHEG
jgi:hypothetical protein